MEPRTEWTPARARKLMRDSHGRFKRWRGGKTKAEVTKKRLNYRAHGIRTHIGAEFKKQKHRSPVLGDLVRTQTKSGAYHKGAEWYIRTRFGWRNSNSKTRPGAATIRAICKNARPSRSRS